MKIYLVGGAVRDELLGVKNSEKDWVVVGGSPEQMLKQGFISVGKNFPVFLHPKTKEEYALARTEKKQGHGYHGFSFETKGVSLHNDLKRRDLTINAIAKDSEGKIIDPCNGQKDLQKKVLRHISPAFSEDPLRVLRVARFAAKFHSLGFTIAPETLNVMKKIVNAGEIAHLAAERIWQEMGRGLEANTPATFFEVLKKCGALKSILPEVDHLLEVQQTARHNPKKGAGAHILTALNQSARKGDNLEVRFAVLVHDLGKDIIPHQDCTKDTGHENNGVVLIGEICARLRMPARYQKLAVIVCRWNACYHRALELEPSVIVNLLEKLDLFHRPKRWEDFLSACEAYVHEKEGFKSKSYPQTDYLRHCAQAAMQCQADDIIQKYSGRQVGEQLRKRRIEAIKNLK